MRRPAYLALLLALAAAPPASAAETIQPGDYITPGCTLAWVYDAPDGRVFFASAAHCFDTVGQVVHLAEAGAGDTVVAKERLGTVRAMGDESIMAEDVALIEVDAAVRATVAPEMRGHPAIPSGVATTAAGGDLLQLSGWGRGFNASEDTRQKRQGTLISTESGHWAGAVPIQGGDSGGPVAHAATGTAFGLVKGYGCRSGNDGTACGSGPTVAGVDTMAGRAGIRLRMRLAGQPAPLPTAAPDPAPAPAPAPQEPGDPRRAPATHRWAWRSCARCSGAGGWRSPGRSRATPAPPPARASTSPSAGAAVAAAPAPRGGGPRGSRTGAGASSAGCASRPAATRSRSA